MLDQMLVIRASETIFASQEYLNTNFHSNLHAFSHLKKTDGSVVLDAEIVWQENEKTDVKLFHLSFFRIYLQSASRYILAKMFLIKWVNQAVAF